MAPQSRNIQVQVANAELEPGLMWPAPVVVDQVLVEHQSQVALIEAFGGLKGEIAYTDDAFGIDPDIQEMFYGDAAS